MCVATESDDSSLLTYLVSQCLLEIYHPLHQALFESFLPIRITGDRRQT